MLKRDALDGDGGPSVGNWNANARKEPQKHANQSVPVTMRGEPIHSVNLRFAGVLHWRSILICVLCGSLRAFATRILRFHRRSRPAFDARQRPTNGAVVFG